MDADRLIIKLQWNLFNFTRFSGRKPTSITMNSEDLKMLENHYLNEIGNLLTKGDLRKFQGITILTTRDLPRGIFSIGITNQ